MENSNITDLSSHGPGIAIVAVAAQFSLLATSFLIVVLSYFRLRNWDPTAKNVLFSEEFCVKFLRSQFAILFFDLLLSDWVQALGFSLNFGHVTQKVIPDSPVCVTQGVLIQLGDTSGAFATFLIAIHTFVVLVIRSPPSTTVLISIIAFKWAAAICLTVIGPLFFANKDSGPFYAAAGGWCWISAEYSWSRLYLHYIWLFIAGIASAVIYGLIFITLRRRIRTHVQHHLRITTDRSTEMSSMENAARKMLFYPLCYFLLTLPLAIYRVAGISGHPWQLDAQLVCGSLFTLAGFVDAIVFCWTRNIFSALSRDRSRPSFISASVGTSATAAAEKASVVIDHNLEQKPKPVPLKTLIQGGSAHQFMPTKYSLATIDLNSFDEAAP